MQAIHIRLAQAVCHRKWQPVTIESSRIALELSLYQILYTVDDFSIVEVANDGALGQEQCPSI